jgi:LPXTG-site transpeptidase (sortase) family protein
MRRKRWPAALAAVVGLVLIVAGVTGLLASCSAQQPQQPPRGQDTVPTPTTSIVTDPAPASSSASPSPSSTGLPSGVLKSSYPEPGDNSGSSVALPVSLTIPVIGVQAPLLELGLVAQGSLPCPADPTKDVLHKGALNTCPLDSDPAAAGWYSKSARPGAVGPAIIAGHINFNGSAVFGRLGELRTGDSIYVTRADGSKVEFRVTSIVITAKTDFPAGGVYAGTGDSELRLISCSDNNGFDSTTGHYYDNIIVSAAMVT